MPRHNSHDRAKGQNTRLCIGWEKKAECNTVIPAYGNKLRCSECADCHYEFMRLVRSRKAWKHRGESSDAT